MFGSLLGRRLPRHGLGSRSCAGHLTCGVAGSGCCRGGAGGIGVELIDRTGSGLLRRSVIRGGSGLVPRLLRGSLIALGLPAVSGGHLLIALVAILIVLVVLTVLIVLVILVVLVEALVGHGCACAAELLRRVCGGCAVAGVRPAQAVALHLLVAQLGDDGRGDGFGDDVELAVLEAFVDDEAHERLAVHGQALLGGLRRQVGFRFTRERGVVAEQTAVVVGVDQHGVERGRVLFAGADHLLAAHLLFGFLGNLNGGDGGVEHLVRRALERVLHFAFELREDAHYRSLQRCSISWRR